MPERGEKVATQKDLEYYLAQFRRIAENREKGAMRKIWTEYKELLKDLKHFLADYYAEYAIDDELTFEILNGKRQYARFLEEVSEHVRHYMPRIAKETISVVDDTYKIAYDGMVDAVEKSVTTEDLKENLKGVKAATPSQVRTGVLNDLSGITPEMTYTKDTAQFIYDLQRTLNTGLVNGDRYSTMAKRVAERCDISYRRSQLIVRTETHRVREKGFLDSGIEINQVLEKGSTPQRITKRWKSMHDEKVRHTKRANHREVDGVTVGIDEEFTLLNGVKAMSPGSSGTAYNDCNCRCILVYELKKDNSKTSVSSKPNTKTAYNTVEVEHEPQQTIEQAETYAQKFISDSYSPTFKNKADFKGISLEHANEINKALERVFDNYDMPKISGIKVISPTSAQGKKAFKDGADAVMSYNPTEKGIFINKDIIKDAKSLEKYNKDADEAFDYVIENIDKLSGSQKKLAETYKNAGRSLVGNGSVVDHLTHELGHHVQWEVLPTKLNNEMGNSLSEYAKKISGYANASKGEYIAESFAAYIKGERDILDPKFVEYMDSILKKKKAK